jgi:hypothetical protein
MIPHVVLTPAGVNTLRGTLPWTAPEIIHSPKAVTDKVGADREEQCILHF